MHGLAALLKTGNILYRDSGNVCQRFLLKEGLMAGDDAALHAADRLFVDQVMGLRRQRAES
jgi:hypothetical protein